jgi:hypothetical protein
MKTSVLLLFFLASLTAATAQSSLELNLATTAGELFPVGAGKLTLVNAWLTSVSANGAPPILAGAVGPVTFTTPEFSSGSVAAGGSFSAGGQFFITSPWDVDVSATFVSGTWERRALPNGSANYVLIAEIKGTFDYEGTNYVFAGHTVEISVAVSGAFRGSQAAGGGSTDAVAH